MLASEQQTQALVSLFHSGTKLTYRKGEFVIRPGETPNSVFYIESGLVKAFNISKYGEENLLIIRKSHEIFPLIWALTGKERDINYQAMSPTVIWRLHPKKYTDYLNSHPDALRPILEMVTEMYRLHSERLLNLEYRTVRERLVSFLLLMCERFGEETEKGILIKVPLRHQDIASSINASRETASRELAALERKGLIDNNQSVTILKDIEALKAFL